jgi:hypothetical protein
MAEEQLWAEDDLYGGPPVALSTEAEAKAEQDLLMLEDEGLLGKWYKVILYRIDGGCDRGGDQEEGEEE